MTPEQQAARWLADVPRFTVAGDATGPEYKHPLIQYDKARAAIARHLAPGDDLVDRATAALEGVTDGPWEEICGDVHNLKDPRPLALVPAEKGPDARFMAFARQWVPEAAARLSALTAERDEARAMADDMEQEAHAHIALWGDALREAATLRDRLARMEGALRDAFMAGYRTGTTWSGDVLTKDEAWENYRAALTESPADGA